VDEHQTRITEDLSGLLRGELRCDPMTVSIYSTDASLYQIAPLGVVFPRDRDDVVTLAQYSFEKGIPLIPRGAGTGLAGGSIGSGLIVDFAKHMNQIESIGDQTVRVQPGVVLEPLNAALKEHGRYFPPDPSNFSVTSIGGMLGVDAAGSRSARVGSTRDHVQSLEMVLAGGHRATLGNEPLDMLRSSPAAGATLTTLLEASENTDAASEENIKRTIISKLSKLLADNESLIAKHQPALIRNTCGYYLHNVRSATHINLARMLVGSEGTLGLFTGATLHTAPLPAHRAVVLLLFGHLEAAMRTVQVISKHQPSACDLLDRRLLTLAREADPRFATLISPAAEAALIVEQTGFSDRGVRKRIQSSLRSIRLHNTRAVVAREAYTFEDVEFLWSLPTRVVPLLTKLKGATRPVPFVEDVAVPPDSLHEFMIRAQQIFQQHQVTASLYAHAAAGQLHLRPFLPTPGPADGQRVEAIARDLYQAVFAVGGTISGEHGDGLSRTAFIRSQYGPLYKVFQQIKDLFDPHNLMNPGKLISDDAHVTLRNLRPATAPAAEPVALQLKWNAAEFMQAAVDCNGCGTCRTQTADMRMCPLFRVENAEEASPRAKANAVRNVVTDSLGEHDLASADMKQLSDLCFNCKQCQLECPANVNIPQLMIEAKAANVAAHGLSRTDWLLSRAHSFGALGSTASLAANWVIENPAARWLLEKFVGVARKRKLFRFARRSFIRSASRGLLAPPRTDRGLKGAVYFVGDYANYYDPELARAFVGILRHNQVPVHVPKEQLASGMAMVSAGDLTSAKNAAEQNVRALVELAREGLPIVCTEPSAAVCLKQEYPMLIDHPDVKLVASQVIDAGEYLWQLHQECRLRTDFEPLDYDVGYHTPCHLKALSPERRLHDLLTLIPKLRVHTIKAGCSGMAGAWGLTRENFNMSIRIGWGLISHMRDDGIDFGVTECCSCKLQMEQGTTKPTLHPIKLLALAYGIMPEVRQKLTSPSGKLVAT